MPMPMIASIVAIVLGFIPVAAADNQNIPGTVITPLNCQIVEVPDQRITVCIEHKGARFSSNPACNFIAAGLCWSNPQATTLMLIALPIVKAAKDRGQFRDLGHCEEIARDSGQLGAILGPEGRIAGFIAGKCGECVCRAAF